MNEQLAAMKPRLVAIVGPSAAGKSWLAQALHARLGKEAARLHLDDFYRDRSHLSLARRAALNFDHPRAIDWKGFERVILACRSGRTVEVPVYDYALHNRAPRSVRCQPKPLVLVEGLWLLRHPRLRKLFDFSIYVHCSTAEQRRRRIRRDQRERGRTAQFARRQFAAAVAPMSRRFVRPQARWANVIVASPAGPKEIDQLAEQLRCLVTGPAAKGKTRPYKPGAEARPSRRRS